MLHRAIWTGGFVAALGQRSVEQFGTRSNGDRLGLMILCSQFAPNVRSKQQRTIAIRGNRALTCVNFGGRYWDRTSDLSGVNGRVGTTLTSEYAADLQDGGAVECG
jgi:hypothetical protein